MALIKKTRVGKVPPQNIRDLRDELNDIFFELRNGTLKPMDAKEANNAAGKIIGTLKVQIEYSQMHNNKVTIDYLEPNPFEHHEIIPNNVTKAIEQ